MKSEFELSVIREQIRQAGRNVRRTRFQTAAGVVLLGILFSALAWLCYDPMEDAAWGSPPPTVPDWLSGLLWITGLALVLGVGAAALCRVCERAKYGRWLAGMSREERAAVLVPLARDEVGDTRKIVAPLIRRFGLPAEVAPAAVPAGTGSEAAADEATGAAL